MHRIRLIGRQAALIAVTAVLLAIVAWFTGSVPQDRAHADFDWANRYYVSCADLYLDVGGDAVKGEPPGPEDLLTSKALTRGEPSQTVPGAVDLTSVTYLGPDLDPNDGIPIPGKPPSAGTCLDGDVIGQDMPENNRLNNHLDYQIVSNVRPTVTATLVAKVLPTGEPVTNLEYATCSLDEGTGKYSATQVSIVLREKGPKGINYGIGMLIPESEPPVGGDPYSCIPKAGTLVYPFVIVSVTRDATTDHPELLKNEEAMLSGDLLIDPDGPNLPKPKDAKQVPDGTDEILYGPYERGTPPHISPMLADDWDGDGCPDWDELDPNAHEPGPAGGAAGVLPSGLPNGLDPFNPHDCNQAVNVSGIYHISTAAVHASNDPATNDPIPGAYYHCIGDMQQDGIDLDMRIYCYIDIPGVPVNPEAGPESGDGFEGTPPPAPYGDVDSNHTVLTGIFNNQTNTVEMSGCFVDKDDAGPLGDVYVESVQDAHSGKGTINIWILQPDGCVGSPVGLPAPGDLESVKVGEKGPCDKEEPKCAAGGQIDSDGDACPDKSELGGDPSHGGLRDPYNRWDYFNPTLDGLNRVDDILKVVGQYFIDKGNPLYDKNTDRTAVIGANPWNLGPPNGQQRVDDILAAVKSYFHDCSGGKFDDPNDETNE